MIGLAVAALLAAAPTEGFLERNAGRPGVRVLPSGIQYRILESGPKNGAQPGPTDEVIVHYEGRLLTGEVFDSSFARNEPAVMPLNRLVPCWQIALPKMRVGDDWIVFCPADVAYGAKGAGGVIPPNAVLSFRIKLIAAPKRINP